jgi:hypothetical protein
MIPRIYIEGTDTEKGLIDVWCDSCGHGESGVCFADASRVKLGEDNVGVVCGGCDESTWFPTADPGNREGYSLGQIRIGQIVDKAFRKLSKPKQTAAILRYGTPEEWYTQTKVRRPV